MSDLKVAVVGGRIGGLVLALALCERGVSFELYEEAGKLREISGAVALSGNGTRELRRLALGDRIEAVSVLPSTLVIRRWDAGEIIADHPIGRGGAYEATFGAPYYGVHRIALLHVLADRHGDHGLNLARRCVGIEARRSGVELHFADGAGASAPLVVGADGVHSVIRPHVAGPARGRFSGTVGYRGLVPVEAMPSLPDPTPLQFRAEPGCHLLRYPIDGGRTVNFLAVGRVPEWANQGWMEECPVRDAVDEFAGCHPAVTEMVGATDVGARCALHDLAPLRSWHTARVVLMGAAAHATPHHQGQGANPDNRGRSRPSRLPCRRPRRERSDARRAPLPRARRRRRSWCSGSRAAPPMMHMPDDPKTAQRDAAFADLYADLASIHSHDARAAHAERDPVLGLARGRT